MNGKFRTTSSSLFNTNNSEQLPDWMKDLNIELKEKENINLDIQTKGAFAEKTTINRDEIDGTPRYLEASFNDTKLITDAKIELAKFLTGRYYKVEANANNNVAKLNVKIDGIPAEFTFNFSALNGKLNNDSTFSILSNGESGEYPYSKAGFEECINDIRANRVKMGSTKVEAVGKYSIINREEIIRRFNGHLRPALDKINDFLKDGSLIGVGSNSYASFYDVEYLFPQMEKEAGDAPLPAFEYVKNTEHVATNEHKSANVLSIEASKMLNEFFADHNIKNCERDNDELLVKADILNNNGVRCTADFCFGIEKEKLASLKIVECNDKRMTIEQFLGELQIGSKVLEAYLNQNNESVKRIYRGIVLTEKEINHRLAKIANRQTIHNIIQNWIDRSLVTPVNSTTYTTEHTFEDLLASVNTKVLTAEELSEINYLSNRTAMYETDRQEVKDTGVREYDDIEASDRLRLNNLQAELTKYFKNFKLDNFVLSDNHTYNERIDMKNSLSVEASERILMDSYTADLNFISSNGTKHTIKVTASYRVNNVNPTIWASVDNNNIPLQQFAASFERSPLLAAYLQDKIANTTGSNIIITDNDIKRRLSAFLNAEEIISTIDNWYEKHLIKDIGNGNYVSNCSFEELLSSTVATLMNEVDRKQIAAIKQHFGNMQKFAREDVQDTGVREVDEYVSDDTLLNSANNFLSKHFNNFQTLGFNTGDEVVNYSVRLFDEESGLSTVINMNFAFEGNKVTACNIDLNGEKVSLENVKKVFAMNETLSKYLQANPGKRTEAPMIMTVENLRRKLSTIANASLEEIEDAISKWTIGGKINSISSNVIASKYTFEQLLSMSNIKPLTDNEIKDRFTKAQRNKGIMVNASYIQDSDTRQPMEVWSSERMLLHVKAELNKITQDYEILDADLVDDKFIVSARVVNPKSGIRQRMKISFNNIDGKLSKLELDDSINEQLKVKDEAVNTYIQHNAINSRQYKNIISKSQLKNKLSTIANVDNMDVLVDSMITNQILKPIDSNTFACDYSLSEIVAHLSRFEKTDLEAGQEQTKLAQRDENTIKISDKRLMDNDTRVLEKQAFSAEKMASVSGNIVKVVNQALNHKMITAKKYTQLMEAVDNAQTLNDLEAVWKELNRYI